MKPLEEYLKSYAANLEQDFDRIRKGVKDSDVKGSANEQIVAAFLEQHVPSKFVLTNVEIMDSYGYSTDELDVCVCNNEQPIKSKPGQPVLAEGVDFVVQVKAWLDKNEIKRVARNCQRLKMVRRRYGAGDEVFGFPEDWPYLVERIPYLVFAFNTKLRLDTLHRQVMDLMKDVPVELQPEGFFVLGKGSIYNFRDGKGRSFEVQGRSLAGWCKVDTKDSALLDLMRYCLCFVPRIHRKETPLSPYFTQFVALEGLVEQGSPSRPNSEPD